MRQTLSSACLPANRYRHAGGCGAGILQRFVRQEIASNGTAVHSRLLPVTAVMQLFDASIVSSFLPAHGQHRLPGIVQSATLHGMYVKDKVPKYGRTCRCKAMGLYYKKHAFEARCATV